MVDDGVSILVAAKAAPVTHEYSGDGLVQHLSVSTGSVVGDLAGQLSVSVVASAATEGDTALAKAHPDGVAVRAAGGREIQVTFVPHSPETLSNDRYGVVTEILWHTMHGLWDRWTEPDFSERERLAWAALHTLNEDITAALVRKSGKPGCAYLVHDYQLGLVPGRLRLIDADARILYFHHVAWPAPDVLALLPRTFVHDYLRGVLGADFVGFFARQWQRNFLRCVEDLLPEAVVDHPAGTVRLADRVVRTVVEPLSLSPEALEGLESRWPDDLDAWVGDRTLLVHAARTDPIKNAHRAVAAFELACAADDDVARARLVLRVNPHRMNLPANAAYLRRTEEAVARLNERFGEERARILVGNDRSLTFGCLRRADVVILNSVSDGQNLTAFEAVALGDRAPVLLISPTCGASEVLGGDALPVHPQDLDDQADALVRAVAMPAEHRARAMERLRERTAGYLLPRWTQRQLDLLEVTRAEPEAARPPTGGTPSRR